MNSPVLLQHSALSSPFRTALERFLDDGRANERIRFGARCPSIKVERTLTKILQEYPELRIEWIEMEAGSGCEFFRGTATIRCAAAERRVRFHWDCKWKAEQQGWTDYFGFADQARAAREFGHECFRTWEEESVTHLEGAHG